MKKRMKMIALALAIASLTACGGGDDVEEELTDLPDSSVVVEAVVPDVDIEIDFDMAVEPEIQEEEPQEEVELFLNPLTGVWGEEDITTDRPVAVMLNNLKVALPQLGVSQADIIYECPAEGGITRMMAVFQDTADVGEIGSVRSARDYFVALAAGLDSIFLHAGGSPTAYEMIADYGVAALDCVNGPYEGTLFWRDSDRISSAGYEHSVLTSGETIERLFATYTNLRQEHTASYTSPFLFDEVSSAAMGTQVSGVTVRYSSYKTGEFTYDTASGLYLVEEYDDAYVDGNNNTQVAVRNVFVLRTDVSTIAGDDAGRLSVRTTGTGDGLYFCDGGVVDIIWSCSSVTGGMTFTLSDGTPLVMGIGSSYINLVGMDYTVNIVK